MTSKVELKLLLQFTNNNEANRYCEAKQLFVSAFELYTTHIRLYDYVLWELISENIHYRYSVTVMLRILLFL